MRVVVGLRERLKDVLEELHAHADARVAHREAVADLLALDSEGLRGAADLPARAVVLDGVVHEVEHHAAHVLGATEHMRAPNVLAPLLHDLDAEFGGAQPADHEHLTQKLGEVERPVLQHDLAVLYLAHVEHIVDE